MRLCFIPSMKEKGMSVDFSNSSSRSRQERHRPAEVRPRPAVFLCETALPACLPQKRDYADWKKVRLPLPLSLARSDIQGMVTGWGKISEGGPVSSTLLKAHMPIKSDKECVRVYGDNIGKPMT